MPRGISRYDERLFQQVIPSIGQQVVNYQNINDPYFSNVSLLLHGDGVTGSRQFYDSSLFVTDVVPVNNAQISNVQSKFGGASMLFNGTNQYLMVPLTSSAFELTPSIAWTMEAWIRPAANYTPYVWTGGGANDLCVTSSTREYFLFGTRNFNRGGDAVVIAGTQTISATTWGHVAAVCNGTGTITLYVNGTSAGTASTAKNAYIGYIGWANDQFLTNPFFNGYIDEVRITKGVSRYTANFAVPDDPFPDFGS